MNNTAAEKIQLTETIERQALVAWFEAASQLELPGYDWRLEQVGDALCSVSASEPSILVNRVLGLGSQDPPTREQLVKQAFHGFSCTSCRNLRVPTGSNS
jgi:hypothetical protein